MSQKQNKEWNICGWKQKAGGDSCNETSGAPRCRSDLSSAHETLIPQEQIILLFKWHLI